jgi:hypothetical protein
MHDFPGTAFNMSLATAPDTNCESNVAVPTWGGGTLGAMANYGTSPGAVLVPGVNAFITNTPPVSQSGTWTVQPGNTPNTTAWKVDGSAVTQPVSLGALANVVSASTEATHVLKASAGSLFSLTVTIGATSGWAMVFDATTAPADGAVTPKVCRFIQSNGTGGATSLAWNNPVSFATGISVAFSSTGCFTKTASSTAFFGGQVQ